MCTDSNCMEVWDGMPGYYVDEDESYKLEYWLNGIVLLVLSCLGITGNIICFAILSLQKTDPNQTFYNLLRWLAAIDSGFLIMCILSFSVVHVSPVFERDIYPYLAPSLIPLLSIFLVGSIYSIVGITVERFFSVRDLPYKNQGAFFGYIVPLVVFSTVYNIPKFFEMQTKQPDSEGPLRAVPTELRLSPEYVYLLSSSCIFTVLVPVSVLILMNSLISKDLKRLSNEIDVQTGYLITSLIGVQVFCHLPRNTLSIYEVVRLVVGDSVPLPYFWIIDVSHIFLALSSSLNLPILLIQDSNFRLYLVVSSRRESWCSLRSLLGFNSQSSINSSNHRNSSNTSNSISSSCNHRNSSNNSNSISSSSNHRISSSTSNGISSSSNNCPSCSQTETCGPGTDKKAESELCEKLLTFSTLNSSV